METFDNADRELLVQLYMLSPDELQVAETMYYRNTGMSACACGKVVQNRRDYINYPKGYI